MKDLEKAERAAVLTGNGIEPDEGRQARQCSRCGNHVGDQGAAIHVRAQSDASVRQTGGRRSGRVGQGCPIGARRQQADCHCEQSRHKPSQRLRFPPSMLVQTSSRCIVAEPFHGIYEDLSRCSIA